MLQLQVYILILLVSAPFLPCLNTAACEETETAHVKLELAKQSIKNAKSLYPKCEDETKDSSNCTLKDRSLAYLNAALDLISEVKVNCTSCPVTKRSLPTDCSDVQAEGFNKSGVYRIYPRIGGAISNYSIRVYCDMSIDGGGWTVIQRRGKAAKQTDFYQDWETYKNGFGDIEQEFWLGNENIHLLTNQKKYSVRFDLVDVKKEYRYAHYDYFSIGDENSGYVLTIRNHSGNATNDMKNDGVKFSTKDRQNDGRGEGNSCAVRYHSAFWFDDGCGLVNLNGIYQPGKDDEKSIWWYDWKQTLECLDYVEIKIRPTI